MTEWHRRNLRITAYRGAAVTVLLPLEQHFAARQSWVDSLRAGCTMVLITLLTMGYLTWRARRTATRYPSAPTPTDSLESGRPNWP